MTKTQKTAPSKPLPKKESFGFLRNRKVTLAEVRSAKKTIHAIESGAKYVRRFSMLDVFQHVVLLVSFFVMALTGIAQTFSDHPLTISFITLVGGIDTLQQVHHLFAIVISALLALHILLALDAVFVRLSHHSLVLSFTDIRAIGAMFKIFFDTNANPPEFDRYKPDEKFTYWVTLLSIVMSFFTGIMMLFPVQTANLFSGGVMPFAISIHRWQAILLIVTIGLLHLYQVLRKKNNVNIFTGMISVEELEIEHPLELAWMKRIAQLDEDRKYPIMFSGSKEIKPKPTEPVEEEGTIEDVIDIAPNVTKGVILDTDSNLVEPETDTITIDEEVSLQAQSEDDVIIPDSPEEGDDLLENLSED